MTSYERGEKPTFRTPANILVASDEDTTRIAISIILSAAGFQVHEAKDGAGIVEIRENLSARGLKVDLLILDVEMEGMRGMRLLESIRASGGFLPTILIVGLNSRHLVASVAIGDRTGILPKPFDPEQLEHAVASILNAASGSPYTDET
jgi:DNA-binding response OmpR family regulator